MKLRHIARLLGFSSLWLWGAGLITGCATSGGVYIQELDRPLIELQRVVVKSLPLGVLKTSPNGREYFSHHFIALDRKFKSAESLPVRRYAHLLVLGDRRPYSIQIIVHVEKSRDGSYYEDVGRDRGLEEVIRKRMISQLNKRRDDLNVIDDFRVF